jgi:5'(3')-deoxyribonucleotidase
MEHDINFGKDPRTTPALYLDCDDVVADWLSEANNYLNSSYDEVLDNGFRMPHSEYKRLVDHQRFYRNLDFLPGALELVDWARSYAHRKHRFLAFLSAIPHDNSVPHATYDKSLWAHEHFPDIPLFIGPYSTDKWKHCKPGDILIDDRIENCMDWEGVGGIAHIYRNWDECRKWIRAVLKDHV